MAAIPEGTIIGPVLDVPVVKILDGCGTVFAIPSIVKPAYTSYVVISRETGRFVNEIHDHKERLRSSYELLTAEGGSDSSKETRASPPSNLFGDSLYNRSFLEVNENGVRLMLTLHQGTVCLQRYPRWSRRWSVITIKMNVKKTDHIIGKL